MAGYTVQLSVTGVETFTAKCGTKAQMLDMVFMVIAAYSPKDARVDANYFERMFNARNCRSASISNSLKTHHVTVTRN